MMSKDYIFGLGSLYGISTMATLLNFQQHFIPIQNILLAWIIVMGFNIWLLKNTENKR